MSRKRHHAEHEHATTTFGLRLLQRLTFMGTLRIRPGREFTDAQKERAILHMEKWIDRWCDRRGLCAVDSSISTVGNPGAPDAVAYAFTAYGDVPVDWTCFAGLAFNLDTERVMGQMPGFGVPMMVVRGGPFGAPGEEGPHDTATVEVDGQQVPVGRQKRVDN